MTRNECEIASNGQEDTVQKLPQNCFPLTHQVAGHFYGKGKRKLGFRLTSRIILNFKRF